MAWLKKDASLIHGRTPDAKSWIRRDSNDRVADASSQGVVTTRDYPGKVTSRTIRNDVYQDALRAAESTLRNSRKK